MNECSKCFYRKIKWGGWCHMYKHPPKKKCGKFKIYGNTMEDKEAWDMYRRIADGIEGIGKTTLLEKGE